MQFTPEFVESTLHYVILKNPRTQEPGTHQDEESGNAYGHSTAGARDQAYPDEDQEDSDKKHRYVRASRLHIHTLQWFLKTGTSSETRNPSPSPIRRPEPT